MIATRGQDHWGSNVPLSIQFGDDIYRDEGSERQRLLRSLKGTLCLASRPQQTFEQKYLEVAEPGDTVISVYMSAA